MTTEIDSTPPTQSKPQAPALALASGSPLHVLRYQSITGQKMWIVEIGDDPEPGDEFGRNIRGSNRLKNAKVFTPDEAEAMLHKVREVHRDAWIERADGSRIQPHPADME